MKYYCYHCKKVQEKQDRKSPLFIPYSLYQDKWLCIPCKMDIMRNTEKRNMRAVLLKAEEEFSIIKFKYERLKAILDDIDQHEGRDNLRNDIELKATGENPNFWLDIED